MWQKIIYIVTEKFQYLHVILLTGKWAGFHDTQSHFQNWTDFDSMSWKLAQLPINKIMTKYCTEFFNLNYIVLDYSVRININK